MASQNITIYTYRRAFRNQRRAIVRYDAGLQCAFTGPASPADWVFKPRRSKRRMSIALAVIVSASMG